LLQRLRLPIPLGGTSCHFRAPVLRWLAAWDAFNVTEDADLGMRLVRRGYVCAVIDSTTYEEATCRIGNWMRQRSRWLKGWMQTYAVHMRHPRRLWRELGPRGFFGFQAVIGGIVGSAFVHPIFYVLAASEAYAQTLLARPESILGETFWMLALVNLSVGYAASMALGIIAARRRGLCLGPQAASMPLYWLLISAAAYRALLQFFTSPFKWEKTEHGLARLADAAARERAKLRASRL
jgi:cellulose synthase/poly-beta-1,6-N-acetylglucosamine synthase-like glycosyltransferase